MWTHSCHGVQVPGLEEDRFSPCGDQLRPFPGQAGPASGPEVLEREALKTEKEAGDGCCWIRWEGSR